MHERNDILGKHMILVREGNIQYIYRTHTSHVCNIQTQIQPHAIHNACNHQNYTNFECIISTDTEKRAKNINMIQTNKLMLNNSLNVVQQLPKIRTLRNCLNIL